MKEKKYAYKITVGRGLIISEAIRVEVAASSYSTFILVDDATIQYMITPYKGSDVVYTHFGSGYNIIVTPNKEIAFRIINEYQ